MLSTDPNAAEGLVIFNTTNNCLEFWSFIPGEDQSQIIVTAGTGNGLITVTPSNGCGDGTSQTLEAQD